MWCREFFTNQIPVPCGFQLVLAGLFLYYDVVILHTMSFQGYFWDIKEYAPNKSIYEKLALLRGVSTFRDLMLEDPVTDLHDPFLMSGIVEGVTRIKQALERKERIVIFGDYDVDGVTATAVLFRTLKKLGADVSFRIPHRLYDGYSLKNYFLDELHSLEVKLVITVDNGIAAAREIAYANTYGIDVIVTDHHTPPDTLPEAVAIINPKLEGCAYPYKDLSGSAVALKFCDALLKTFLPVEEREQFFPHLIQIAGIGIVADCMQITGENKALVKISLQTMADDPLPGVRALLQVAGIERTPTEEDIAFYLAPRLNAAGRLDSAYSALQLFLYPSGQVENIAKQLHILNSERRAMTEAFTEEALSMLSADELPPLLFAASDRWNSGINGLIASRLVQKFARPVIIASYKDGVYTGSCRSIKDFNMVEALKSVSDILLHFGGHHGAAGFSLQEEYFEEFQCRIGQYAELLLHDVEFVQTLHIDTDIGLEDLTLTTLDNVAEIGPFGLGNTKPKFLVENVSITKARGVGQDTSHLAFEIHGIKCIAFGMGQYIPDILTVPAVDIVCSLERNVWNGRTSLSLMVYDIREHLSSSKSVVKSTLASLV